MTSPRRYMAGTAQHHQQQPANSKSHVPAQPTRHGCVCMCVSTILCKQNADQRPPTTATSNQPPPTITDDIPATSSRTFPLHLPRPALGSAGHHPKALPSLCQVCAKPAPRSASGLARCAMDARLSAALIGCGGRLMRLGGCRLQQHRPPTDSLLLFWV